MNLQRPNANDATRTANRSRNVAPMSGLCTRCVDGCTGNCEVFKATFRGRELIYPGPFGDVTAGGDKDYPLDYSHLNRLFPFELCCQFLLQWNRGAFRLEFDRRLFRRRRTDLETR